MRPKVALVLPGRHLQELAEEALKEMGEEATVYPGPEFHPERVVGRARREGALVLVAPPPISRSLRQVGTLPVVELEPTSFELVEALLRAREAGKPIALFHFGKAGPDEATLTRLAGARVSCLALPKDAGEVHQKLLEVGREGAVVVGGRTTVELASRLGIPGVAVVAGKAAIVEAVQRARAVLAAMPAAGSETEAADLVPPAESAGDVPPGAEAVAAATRQDLAEDAALPPWEKVVALSEAMAQAVALADQIATSSAPALIWGELGAGKSFLCRYIHRRRGGAAGNLWVIQCGAGGGTLKQKLGSLLERAAEGDPESKGTLVLEQVEELPPEWQHQFVGFLEATGDTGLRVLATTRGALKKAVDAGHFREDLYWRLGVLQLRVPPLRERKDDLEPLLAAFLVQVAREPIPFSGEGLSRLLRYRWPGNVRELGSFAQRYWLLWKGLPLFPAEERERMALDDFLSAVEEDALRAPIAVIPGTLESMEAQIMSEMARRIKGSKAEVARRLGISRTTLWKRMKEAGRAPAGGEGMIG